MKTIIVYLVLRKAISNFYDFDTKQKGSGSITYQNQMIQDGTFKEGVMIGQAKLYENAAGKGDLIAVQHLKDGR